MPRLCIALVVVPCLLLAHAPVSASPLDSKRNEWAFDLDYQNVNGGGSATDLRASWGHLFGKGYNVAGIAMSYARVEDTGFTDPDTSTTIVGPFYTWHWTPSKARGTGFLSIGTGAVAGDDSAIYDWSADVSVGVKLFVGSSAAVSARVFGQVLAGSLQGADTADLSGLAVGISIFTSDK